MPPEVLANVVLEQLPRTGAADPPSVRLLVLGLLISGAALRWCAGRVR
jgi:hypothetical protein